MRLGEERRGEIRWGGVVRWGWGEVDWVECSVVSWGEVRCGEVR